jgi:hypothetical protein
MLSSFNDGEFYLSIYSSSASGSQWDQPNMIPILKPRFDTGLETVHKDHVDFLR